MPNQRYNSVKPTLAFLALASLSLNRQDAKNAKVGFTELRRRCGYKALG